MNRQIRLLASKYTLNIVHENGVLHKIVNISSYDNAVQWGQKIQRTCTPLMIVIVDDEGNTEEVIVAEKDERTSKKIFYQCDQTGQQWWAA